MTARARSSVTVAAVAAILVGSACASAGSGPRDPGASQAPASVYCPTTPVMPGRTNESIPAGFKTAWVLGCRDDERAVPGDGTWHFRIEERADTNAAALVVALRKPDKKTPSGTACPGIATSLGYFALVDESGKAIYPRVPIDFCNQPQDAVVEALKTLPFHEVKATPLNQEQSQQSIDTEPDRHRVRHELRAHAGAGLDARLSPGPVGDGAHVCCAVCPVQADQVAVTTRLFSPSRTPAPGGGGLADSDRRDGVVDAHRLASGARGSRGV
jgi:hypothetical protein